jgi:hypothetical protein
MYQRVSFGIFRYSNIYNVGLTESRIWLFLRISCSGSDINFLLISCSTFSMLESFAL